MGVELRPYQQQLITEIAAQFQLGSKSVLAVLPTGGGKSLIFSFLAKRVSARGKAVLVLVHRQELLDQASRSLTSLDVGHGLIQAGKEIDLSPAVQVASIQTLARRLHSLPRHFFSLLIADECHHSTASQWSACIQHFNTAKLLGFTATPIRGDGQGLKAHYEVMVQGPTAGWLTDNGFLAPAKVLAPPGFKAEGLRKQLGDFDMSAAALRVSTRQLMGDCLTHYQHHLAGKTAIAFCCSVAHAESIAKLFRDAGIAASSIDGTMNMPARHQLLTDLGKGKLKILSSCSLIGEGIDVPSVAGCILLRPTASVGLHLQMIGRCLRPHLGKRAVVLDHVGNSIRLGHHLEQRNWTLDGLKKRDRQLSPSVKVCPNCFAAMASAKAFCTECGHVFAHEEKILKVIPGELRELAISARKNEQRKANSLEALISLGEERGYKNPVFWAQHVINARRGGNIRANHPAAHPPRRKPGKLPVVSQ